jgi:hypothetical protein
MMISMLRRHLCRFQTLLPAAAALLLVLCTGTPAAAQEQDPATLYHWAYASAFGTGAYRFGDDAVFAVRLTPEYSLRDMDLEEGEFGVALSFPVTLSVQQTSIDELIGGEIPDSFQTVSFVPGLELQIPMNPKWVLKPYGHMGWGVELSGDDNAAIYYAGLNSRYALGPKKAEYGILTGLQYYGYTPTNGPADRFFRFMAGVELDYQLDGVEAYNRQLYLKPHVIYYHYFGDLDFSILSQPPVEIKHEWELGFAVGTEKFMKFWGFRFDRIGIAYRAGSQIDGIRLFFRSVFD